MKILIVEDDELLQSGLEKALQREGYSTDCAACASNADAMAQVGIYSLIILDLGLPDMDGGALLKKWRAAGRETPVLVLTARDALDDRVAGLDAGADDYLIKPFALPELKARVRALIRRHHGYSENKIHVDDLTLDLNAKQAFLNNRLIDVTPKEFSLLSRLMMKANSTVHRDILQNDLYSFNNDPSGNVLEVHMHNLRRKIGKDRIKTVRGIGYRLDKSL
ncbi:two-component system response regulator PmrA [Affinibrenneria salicis]|uniref:Two-component system response regulator PmrA n=1 Tax=Affinibrenneria salicis TaxID=2590031 RepID=A0A5J5G1N3_9GAMM|nr:two-component system response regulator PmrA [Affinibrenneria salicis]KAA9000558.1 two-component system response regulator PmrA [Affinibrenneria salicis]